MNASKESEVSTPINEISIPTKLNILTALLTIIALAIIYWSAGELAHQTRIGGIVVFTVLAVLTLPFAISLPMAGAVVLFGDTYLMALAIMHGTAACVAATACYALAFVLLMTRRVPSKMLLFNFSSMVCGAFMYSTAYQLTRPSEAHHIATMIFPALAMALISFVFNSVFDGKCVFL